MAIAFFFGKEFLNGREHHAAGCHGKLRSQVGAVGGLHRRLAQEIAAPRECTEQLVVEIVAIGQNDDRGIFHFRGRITRPA